MNQLNRILLIDDDASINFLHSEVLKFKAVSASYTLLDSSAGALETLRTSEKEELPDLILLDLNMPVVSGWDFLDQVKTFDEGIQNIPVVILTSSMNPDDIAKSKDYTNVIGFLSKPLDVEELTEVMSQYRSKQT